LIRFRGEHSHKADVESNEKRHFVENCNEKIRVNTVMTIPKIVRLQSAVVLDSANTEIENIENLPPSFKSIKSSLYRMRNKIIPQQPPMSTDFELSDAWKTTKDGRDFILEDNNETDRIIIFGTEEFFKMMCKQTDRNVFMDGTFKSTPTIFAQIYTIHVLIGNHMLPTAYCLMPNRMETTYIRLISMIKSASIRAGVRFAPSSVQVDYEQAVIRAIEDELPETRIRGCYFHFAQSLWRKIQELGLEKLYRTDDSVRMFVRRIVALSFLPVNAITVIWTLLCARAPRQFTGIPEYILYAEQTWISGNALFPKQIWNQYDNMGPRTNNHLEGFHAKLNRRFSCAHPNIFKLILVLMDLQKEYELVHERSV
jgi:hypothetical protein